MRRIIVALLLLLVPMLGGGAECTSCHAGQAVSLEGSAHAVEQWPQDRQHGCIGCHGDSAAHASNPMAGGVLAFDDEAPMVKDAACGSCHRDVHAAPQSAHARAGLACSDCHAVHEQKEAARFPLGFRELDRGSAACVGCHEDVLASFAFTKRHRLQENSVTCTSCHDPHAAAQTFRLAGAGQQQCGNCHADKQGPFIFEHGASRVDGCVSCHAPHGSPNRFMLSHQRVGEQCYSCHAGVPQFHLGFSPVGSARFGLDSVCTNCHSTIHGSNLDPLFLK